LHSICEAGTANTHFSRRETRASDFDEQEIMMKVPGNELKLTDMPNVGEGVAGLLVAAGIRSPQQLKRLGAVAAAIRIRNIRPQDPPCRSMLAGLEGAIRGMRWHTIPKVEREAIWKEYEARTSGRTVRAAARP